MLMDCMRSAQHATNWSCVPTLARALWKARECPEGSPEEDWFRAERALSRSLSASGAKTIGRGRIQARRSGRWEGAAV
jgi:hypothetical protein